MAENNRDIVVLTVREDSEESGHGGSWKVAYADFVTALMALFLLLWLVMALKPQQKAGLAQFFKDPKDLAKVKLAVQAGAPAQVIKARVVDETKLSKQDQIQRDIQSQLKNWVTQDAARIHSVDVLTEDRGVLVYINNSLLFDPGSTQLKPGVVELMQSIAKIMKGHDLVLEIRGHADDSEQIDKRYANKWTLSGVRAVQAKRLLCETQGIPCSRVEAIGFGDSQPLFPVNRPGNKDKNRRLDFYFAIPTDTPPPAETTPDNKQDQSSDAAQADTASAPAATAPSQPTNPPPETPAASSAQTPPSTTPEPTAQMPPSTAPSAAEGGESGR